MRFAAERRKQATLPRIWTHRREGKGHSSDGRRRIGGETALRVSKRRKTIRCAAISGAGKQFGRKSKKTDDRIGNMKENCGVFWKSPAGKKAKKAALRQVLRSIR